MELVYKLNKLFSNTLRFLSFFRYLADRNNSLYNEYLSITDNDDIFYFLGKVNIFNDNKSFQITLLSVISYHMSTVYFNIVKFRIPACATWQYFYRIKVQFWLIRT